MEQFIFLLKCKQCEREFQSINEAFSHVCEENKEPVAHVDNNRFMTALIAVLEDMFHEGGGLIGSDELPEIKKRLNSVVKAQQNCV